MHSGKHVLKQLFLLVACVGLVALAGCTPEVPQKWKDMGFPIGDNTELRVGETQDAKHLAVDHLGTSAHQEICDAYMAKFNELGYEQDPEAESTTDDVQVIRTVTKDGESIKLECRDVADRAIVRLEVQ